MLPIVQRELSVAARNPKLYRRRLVSGFLLVLAACVILLLSAGGFKPGAAESFFYLASHLALILCLLEGVRKTSDCISSEKRGGTLGFLFLSNLSGADVVLGKFVAALLRSLSVLLPFFPVLAISLLLGGTTLGEFWRVALVLVLTLIASLAVCLLVSTISREQSIAASMIALVGLVALPPIVASLAGNYLPGTVLKCLRSLSPFVALEAAEDLRYNTAPGDYWCAIAVLSALSFAALAGASLLVRRVSQDKPAELHRTTTIRAKRPGKRRKLLDENPVSWLAYNERGRLPFLVLSILITLAGLLPLTFLSSKIGPESIWPTFPALAAGVLTLFIWLRLAVESSTFVAEAKASGSLELILSTPLTVDQVLFGFYRSLWRRYRIPIICSLLLMLTSFLFAGNVDQTVWLAKWVTEVVFQIPVIATVGTRMGLRSKTRAAAVVYTILLGAIVPWIVCVFTIVIQIILITQSTEDSKRVLRRIRTAQNSAEADAKLQPPVLCQNVPPVLR